MENIYNAIQNVYNMDKTTWQEVLAELYNLVSKVENKFDLFENNFGPLLGEEVIIELKKMYDDGSLATLINEKLLKDINTKVDTFKTEVSEQMDNKADVKNTTDWINVVSLGVDNTNTTESSSKINQIISENQGKTIFLPKGDYKILSPIIIDGVDFVCEGTIYIENNIGVNLISPYTKVKINRIEGTDYDNKKGVGLKIGNDSKIVTASHVEIGMIKECETALLLNPNNKTGVQCSTFEFDSLSRCTYGIKIQGGNSGIPWVNENKFICRGSLNCEYGVFSQKGLNMVDPYNGNKFINLSIEQCKYPFVLNYMNANKFENIRCAESENGLVDYIFNLTNCNLNTFTSNIPNAISRINETNCNNNFYDFIIQKDEAGSYIGKSLRMNNGRKFLAKGEGITHTNSVVGSYNKTTNTIDYIQKLELINMSCDANKSSILVLDNRYGVDGGDYNEFMVDVQFMGENGEIQIKNSSGTVVLDQTKLVVGKHLIKFIGGNWYSFKAN